MAFYALRPYDYDPYYSRRYVDPFDDIFRSTVPLVQYLFDDDDEQQRRSRTSQVARSQSRSTDQRRRPQQYWHAIVDVSSYDEDNINTAVEGTKIIVTAKQEIREGDDFHTQEMRKTVEAPSDVDLSKLEKKFRRGHLILYAPKIDPQEVDVPVQTHAGYVKKPEGEAMQVEPAATGGVVAPVDPKKFQVKLDMSHFPPENIKITTKGRMVTVSANKEDSSEDHFFRSSFKRSFLLPENIDPQQLKSNFKEDGTLSITMKDTDVKNEQ